jgi:hypothetical protein
MVTDAPTKPDVGFKLAMLGAGTVTVKLTPLLATPPTVTTTFPLVAPAGTAAVMLVALQLVAVAETPLNFTVLVPCVAPKLAPVMVTDAPTKPDVGFKLAMLGAGTVTVKLTALLATPPTVTTTFPLVAPAGTAAVMLVALHAVAVAPTPLNVTVLVPCVAPKFAPLIVTAAPTTPEVGFKPVTLGTGTVTVKPTPLLATPPTVATTFPLVAPAGTGTEILVAPQLVGVAAIPLNFTVLVPCVAPRFVPVIVTAVPTTPEVGFKLAILGAGTVTVKLAPLLDTPPTVTTTFPLVAPAGTAAVTVVALQLVGTAAIPLNVTVLVPCVAPKFVPVIVTEAPTTPDVGFKPVTLGPGTATVKLTPLLATPPTVTTTFPLVAPAGTGATMLVALQLVGTAAIPLNVTVLVPCVAPKFAPLIVTDVPITPDVGFRPVMLAAGTALFTLTATPALVVAFPDVSVATAVNMWFPSARVVVFSA